MTETLKFIIYVIVLFVCFPFLYSISKDYFIVSLEKISIRLKLSSDVAGSTLMAAGSSTPELAVVLFALLKPGHHEAIGAGTIVGSALFNLFVIVGAVTLFHKSKLMPQPLIRDLIFYSVSIVLLVLFFRDGEIVLFEALIFVTLYIVYIILMYYWKSLFPNLKDTEEILLETDEDDLKKRDHSSRCSLKSLMKCFDIFLRKVIPEFKNMYFTFGFSLILICAISWLMVESAINISQLLGISEVIIGLTVMAIGTSLPDMMSSIIVAKQGRSGMAINCAIGSNIFDILIGLGLPWLLLLAFSSRSIVVEKDDLGLVLAFLIGSVLILTTIFIINKWNIKKWMGYMFIILYIIYLYWEIHRAI